MRIAIDARALTWTGIGRYIRNLLLGLAYQHSSHHFIVLIKPEDQAAFDSLRSRLGGQFEPQLVEGSYYSWREQTVFLAQLLRSQADLYHFTHFNRPLLFSRRSVVTVHDVTRFIYPGQRRQTLGQQFAYEMVFSRAVRMAAGVIFVSHTTQRDARALPLRIPRATTVIYEGVDEIFHQPINEKERQKVRLLVGTNQLYLLYVGVWMSHKNLNRLLHAFARLSQRYPRLHVVLTGKPKPGYDNLVKLTRTLQIEDRVIFAGFVPEELLPALYAEAACFVFPSLYEGFGLPPLEAAACGTPVITSNISSLPEIMGDAASYVNPEDTAAIEQAIDDILTRPARRAALIAAGQKRAALFRWEEAGQQHLKFYERVMGNTA